MKQQTGIIYGVIIVAAAVLLATAAYQVGFNAGLESEQALPEPTPTEEPTPTPPPQNFTLTITGVNENGEYTIDPDYRKTWKMHPYDTVTFKNDTGETVTVTPDPLDAYVQDGTFVVPAGGSPVIKTVAPRVQPTANWEIWHKFGDSIAARGPRMVVTEFPY